MKAGSRFGLAVLLLAVPACGPVLNSSEAITGRTVPDPPQGHWTRSFWGWREFQEDPSKSGIIRIRARVGDTVLILVGPADDPLVHVELAKIDDQGKAQYLAKPDLAARRGTAYVVFQPRHTGQYRVHAYYFYMSGHQELGTWDITVSVK